MYPDDASCYAALLARDHRFDGRFFVGVTSTGVYCRPVCKVRTPKAANCQFFGNAALAERAGFRPCRRCRPELAPGLAAIDFPSRLAWVAAQRIESGLLNELGINELAARLGITERHLRRVFRETFGVTPVAYAQTQRLLNAKRLLMDTQLPITELALAAGFGSLRRFNALFLSRYRLAPSTLRRSVTVVDAADSLRFELAFRPPFDWTRLLEFLSGRCVKGVEDVTEGRYRRSVRIESGGVIYVGWLSVTLSLRGDAITVAVSPSLVPVLPAVLSRIGRVFDLSADPIAVSQILGSLAAGAPGLRIPGAFDGFEMAVRAVLGQQVTVKAAHTLAGRFVATLGDEIVTPFVAINRIFPAPQRVARSSTDEIASLGIVGRRANAILALAREVAEGRLDLGPATDVIATMARLEAIPGVGPWTAQYIALRALAWTDAWPSGDVALIKALGASNARQADERAEAWHPWRGYATMHLWRHLAEGTANDFTLPLAGA